MKNNQFIKYLLFVVYIFMLSHTVTPHNHHTHELTQTLSEYVADNGHCAEHDNHDEHEHHSYPHHDSSQHADYDHSLCNIKKIQSQLASSLILFCSKILLFDFTPPVSDTLKLICWYIPLKVPIHYSYAVPLRAPPVV